jgi:hypothetical protein
MRKLPPSCVMSVHRKKKNPAVETGFLINTVYCFYASSLKSTGTTREIPFSTMVIP